MAEVYTDGSILQNKVTSGIFFKNLGLRLSSRHLSYCSMLQAKVIAIFHAADLFRNNECQVANIPVTGVTFNSKLIKDCLASLGILSRQFSIYTFIWVSDYREMPELRHSATHKDRYTSSVRLSIRRKYWLEAEKA